MPAAIPWGENEIEKLASRGDSRIFLVQKKIPVVLQPFHLQDLKSAVRDLLNSSIDSYHKPLEGIILSYKHLKIISKSASVAAETSGVVLTIQADFFVFRPEVGNVLTGVVNKISKDHVGVLLYHRFNISCPRPSSESRSDKWLGNQVSMHQEATFKVKEANFSGTLPFLKGKLLSIGNIIAATLEEERKPNKKKKKDKAEEESEQSSSLVTPVIKVRKHKLDETKETGESKAKKLKKEIKFGVEDITKSVLECSNAAGSTSELPVTKKKKRVSIGTDFIPRLSLDVSQLPEDLPPPNADSTHFDVAKNLSSLNRSEKKRRKETKAGLSDIREESSEVTKSLQNVHGFLENSSKDQLGTEEKLRKKKEKKEKKQRNDSSHLGQEANTNMTGLQSPKKLKLQSPQPGNSLSQVDASSRDNSDSPRKKKKKQLEPDCDLKTVGKIGNVVSSSKSFSLAQSSLGEISFPKKKKSKNSEPEPRFPEPLPVKEKKSKKDKKTDISVPSDSQEIKSKVSKGVKDSKALSQSKNKTNETPKDSSTSKKSKKKQEKDMLDVSLEVGSDDTIPPGQRLVSESPLKPRVSNSPQRRQSLSFSLGYFAPSSGMDLDLGPMRGARRAPLMFGDLEKKILPPEMSPVKPSPSKKEANYDSDSDPPKKVVMSTSVRRKTSDSDDSDSDGPHSTAKSPQKSFHSSKRAEYSSDDSDSDSAIKSKLLQSMGVMQSPLKTAKPNVKQETSDSESDRSIDVHHANVSKFDKSFSHDDSNNSKKSSKTILPNKVQGSPKKSNTQVTKPSPSKEKVALVSTPAVNGDSDDSDLEIMKTAIALLEEEKRLGIPFRKKLKVTPKKANQNVKEKIHGNTSDALAVPMPTPKKKKNLKEKIPASAPDSLVNSSTATSKKKTEKSETVLLKPVTSDSSKVLKSTPSNKKIEKLKEKINNSDSDSGPDDRNTSDFLTDMRNKRQAAEAAEAAEAKKTAKSTAKSKKQSTGEEIPQPINNTKPKKQKISGHSKESTEKESKDVKKPKSKGKKKSTDDEISDVMQRLLREAKMNVGLA